jgi:phosphoribosylanthranilate isomerase
MNDIKVKICGIKDSESALVAEENGADYIGLVFCKKSKRCISINQAKKIILDLKKKISVVALFSNDEESHIKSVINNLNIDIIQFHGDEIDSDCIKYNLPYIKGISASNNKLNNLDEEFPNAKAFILDSHSDDGLGGTGRTFDWSQSTFETAKPIMIAGGLNCDNVEDAIKVFLPYGVDVSSGVESDDGKKNLSLIKKFICKAKSKK